MNAPSNANTSGLEVVAWDSDVLDTFSGFSSNVLTRTPHVAKTGERVRSQAALVTAASAQARIAELEAEIAEMIAERSRRSVAWQRSEARADRLASTLTDLVSWFDKPVQGERGMVWVIRAGDQGADDAVAEARAALQQETQP